MQKLTIRNVNSDKDVKISIMLNDIILTKAFEWLHFISSLTLKSSSAVSVNA